MIAIYLTSTIISILVAIIFYAVYELVYKQKRIYDVLKSQNVPGDSFKPLFGHIARFSRNDQTLQVRQRQREKHGNIYLLSFGHRVNLVLTDPVYISDVLRRNAKCYKKPELFRTVFGPLIGGRKNLFAGEGEYHRRLRKMLNPAFQHSKLQSMVLIMTRESAEKLDELQSNIICQDSELIDLESFFYKLTLSIIISCVFGQEIFAHKSNEKELLCNAYKNAIKAIEYRSMYMVNQIPVIKNLPFWKKDIVDKGSSEIQKFVNEIMTDYRKQYINSPSTIDSSDILHVLLSATDWHGVGFTDQELRQETASFLFAGHEASSNLLTWSFYVLMTHRDVYRDCQDEIDRLLEEGMIFDFHKLNKMHIIDAVLHETLRCYPPLPTIRRECITENCIGPSGRQIRVPIGTSINIDVYGVHRSAEYWHDPLEFNYKRWLGDEKQNNLSNSYVYLPFSGGNRSCIGQPFALLEAKIITAMLLQRFDFELIQEQSIIPDIKLTMKPKNGLLTRVKLRNLNRL